MTRSSCDARNIGRRGFTDVSHGLDFCFMFDKNKYLRARAPFVLPFILFFLTSLFVILHIASSIAKINVRFFNWGR